MLYKPDSTTDGLKQIMVELWFAGILQSQNTILTFNKIPACSQRMILYTECDQDDRPHLLNATKNAFI